MKRTSEKGFTFIELAMVMIIAGLIMTIVTGSLYLFNLREARRVTQENLETVQLALIEYVASNGAYPCPADISLRPGDLNYGVAAVDALGNCTGGSITVNGRAGLPVRIGSVPYETIMPFVFDTDRFSETSTIDAWGNKITYAVTESLTAPLLYDEMEGAIEIVDEFDIDVIQPAGRAHLILISHGSDKIGGYPRSSSQQFPGCNVTVTPGPPPPPGTPTIMQLENCDENDGKFLSGLRSENSNFYNDDYVRFMISRTASHWRYTSQNTVTNTNTGNVGVGSQTPQQKVHFAGDLRADNVSVMTMCDSGGANCMPVSTLAGTGFQCPNGEVLEFVQNNAAGNCVVPFTGPTSSNCTVAGEVAVGLSNRTGVICE